MEVTNEYRRRLKRSGSDERLGVKPVEAGRLIGESRNTVYRLLAAGKLHAVKRGTSTIVLMDSIRSHMASLPPATFGADRADT
jgi:Helix-turn-helix domain